MNAATYSVLLGIGEHAQSRRLQEILAEHGVRCEHVTAGPGVIERALFERYQAIILDPTLALLSPQKVRELLRTNPRTRAMPVFLIDTTGMATEDNDFVQKPAEDLAWLASVLPALGDDEEDGSIAADLRQVQLPDILQMLLQNGRTGIAEVESSGKIATIEIAESAFGHIQLDAHEELKALARIIPWRSGSFRFHPRSGIAPNVSGSALNLLLDAVRLADEARHLRQQIPAGSRLVYSDKSGKAPSDPVLEEVLMLVDFYGAVDDILERIPAPDAEVLAAILKLRDEGWVDIHTPAKGASDGATDWPDLIPSGVSGDEQIPIVWVIGHDADFVRVLWSDSRLQARNLSRKSLRNGGRFGGNGWLLELGRSRLAWLRFLPPSGVFESFANRGDLLHAGFLGLVSPHDHGELEAFVAAAQVMQKQGKSVAWLMVGEQAQDDDDVKKQLSGLRLYADDDPPTSFWHALAHVLGADAGHA